MVTVSRATAVVFPLATLLVASCTRYVDDARAVAADDRSPLPGASQCEAVDAPLTTIAAVKDDEPVMKIPQPQGWTRSTKLDSELFRFAMINRNLVSDGFAPNVVVTLESVPGFEHPAEVFESQRAALESGFGATDLRVTEHTLCGQPAETVQYLTPEMGNLATHPGTVVMAVMHTDDATYAASVTIQTANPDDPTYRRDAEVILTGFQFLPPEAG
ncbi:hypothetical protein A5724_29085 [Mycobacterium sp. ACS1612]|uniref:LpqN/LpqT family lipoprotein n=1 Tax=Mycobacterium sp. ACS1612 TaxID=1834117 RepID=UPI0007FBC103|nr:LpqN/LpqT family lipoprotein [Mycobacterium sp. ACS1612]OBF27678.1 hypothetical protein A5724_29085 [Mycobacterium sp. ACS1612]